MSGYQLGRVGIVLLALYVLMQALLGAISIVTISSRSAAPAVDAESVALSVATFLVVVLLIGALPATILIANRDALSRRWFGVDAESEVSITSKDLFKVGLVLLAVAGIWEGVVGLGSAGMLSASLRSAPASQLEGAAGTVSSTVFRSASNVALGMLLLWIAKPLSNRWF